jgi:hypothetical protein
MKIFKIPWSFSLSLISGLLLCLMAVPTLLAAQGGNGNGGGGGNQGDGPDNGVIYGDAVYLLRDPDTGVPVTINGCIRPLWGPDGGVLAVNADFATDDYKPEVAPENIEGWSSCEPAVLASEEALIKQVILADDDADDELEACDVIANCMDYVTEADLGRLSILKSPDRVLDRQLEEAITKLESGGEIKLDASGRPVVGGVTFDSPLLNLALFREFHLWGAIVKNPLTDNEEVVYEPAQYKHPHDFILAAAFGLGAGDDKEDPGIDLEIAVRTAAIIDLGGLIHELGDEAVLPESYEFTYEGRTSYFANYSGFSYSRKSTFPGNVCYDFYVEADSKWYRESGSIMEIVFGDPEDVTADQLTGFALAANDARRVLVFAHDNQIVLIDSVFESTELTEQNCPPLN